MDIQNITSWLKEKIAEESGLSVAEIDLNAHIESFALDSLSTVSIAHDLEQYLEMQIEPTILWEFETLNELIAWILEKKN
jgi:acyl carrier protein